MYNIKHNSHRFKLARRHNEVIMCVSFKWVVKVKPHGQCKVWSPLLPSYELIKLYWSHSLDRDHLGKALLINKILSLFLLSSLKLVKILKRYDNLLDYQCFKIKQQYKKNNKANCSTKNPVPTGKSQTRHTLYSRPKADLDILWLTATPALY